MPTLARRLEALEAQHIPPWSLVVREDWETDEQAKERVGVQPGEVVIVLSRLDEAL